MKSRRSISVICIILALLMLCSCSKSKDNGAIVGKLEGKNGDKLWISDIPGAFYHKDVRPSYDENNSGAIYSEPWTVEEITEQLKENSVVIGNVENVKCFSLTINDSYVWYIMTFDIRVTEEIRGDFDKDLLKCVLQYKYDFKRNEEDGKRPNGFRPGTSGKWVLNNESGVFAVKEVEDSIWIYRSNTYNVCDYADYFVGRTFNYTPDGIKYMDDYININEIKDKND